MNKTSEAHVFCIQSGNRIETYDMNFEPNAQGVQMINTYEQHDTMIDYEVYKTYAKRIQKDSHKHTLLMSKKDLCEMTNTDTRTS